MAGEEQVARQLGQQYDQNPDYRNTGLTRTEEQAATAETPSTQAIGEALGEGRRLAKLTAEGVLSEEDLVALGINVSDIPDYERPQNDIVTAYQESFGENLEPAYDPTDHSVDPTDF